MVVVIIGLVALQQGAQSNFAATQCPPPSRAYVLIGDASGFLVNNYALNAAAEAESDFQDAGYTVVRDNTATSQDVVDAVSDPCARAIWIFGHGLYNTKEGIFGKEKATNPEEAITTTDGVVTGDPATGWTVVPANPNLRQVTIHSCGQDLPSWRALFPGATFHGWSSNVRGFIIFWWQYFHKYPTINPNTGLETASLDLPSPPVLASSLEQYGDQVTLDPETNKFISDLGPVANSCLLTGQLKDEFATQTFNLIASDEDGMSEVTLFGATVEDGCITSVDIGGSEAATFEITMTYNAVRGAWTNPTEFATFVEGGEVDLVSIPPIVTTPTPTPPSDILLEGFRQVLFGGPPPVGGIAEHLVDSADGPPSPADGSGSSALLYAALAGGIAAAVVALMAGGWYVRRRFRQRRM